MRAVINAISSKMGGAATYLDHLCRHLAASRDCVEWILFVPPAARPRCERLVCGNATVLTSRWANRGALLHFLWQQVWLRVFLMAKGVDRLVNLSAYGLLMPPCPQTILLRNPVVFSRRYVDDLTRRGLRSRVLEVRLRRELMRLSTRFCAEVFVPTRAMGECVVRWFPRVRPKLRTNAYGVELPSEPEPGGTAPWQEILARQAPENAVRILYVSHFSWHKNFDTLIEAIPAIRRRLGRPFRVVLTAEIGPGVECCYCDTTATARRAKALGVEQLMVPLGTVPHGEVGELYRSCDVFVFPSYCESFGQPLAEAMAAGLPIAAAGEPVCREVCGEAAVYFKTFDAEGLAEAVCSILAKRRLAQSLASAGAERARGLPWARHFETLLGSGLTAQRPERCGVSALVITRDEEANIRDCLKSLGWADEVFVVDSYSTDGTVAICREFAGGNVRLVQHRFRDYAAQRNWALTRLPWRNDWVFVVDADETVPVPVTREVLNRIRLDRGRYVGYAVKDDHIFLGWRVRNATRLMVRLFRRSRGRYARPVNEKLQIDGGVGRLSNRVRHETRKDLAHWVAKNNTYSSMEAVEYRRARSLRQHLSVQLLSRPDLRRVALKAAYMRMPFRPVLMFLYMYFWRGGILDGAPGLIYSVLTSWVAFQIGAKMFERTLRREGRLTA